MKSVICDDQSITPSKVVCIGRNYVAHIEELNNEVPTQPVVFIKPNSAISDELNRHNGDEVHYEGEICFLIKQGQLAAVGFGLDLTKRAVQSGLKAKGLPWERAKAFDGAAVFSKFVSYQGALEDLHMQLFINDICIQQGGYELMLNKPQAILEEVESFLSLEDGDIIMTGTPAGVGELKAGDRFVGKIFQRDNVLVQAEWQVQ